MEKIKKAFEKIKTLLVNIKFKNKVLKEKKKLYGQNINKKYYSKRNKFKLFKSKLEFENTFNEVKKISIYYYYLIGFFLILSSLYVLFFSHYFSLKTIDILREDEFINIDLSYKSVEDFRYKPIFFIDKNEIKKSIFSHQPNIKDISIRKIMPDNIKIILNSYKSYFGFEYDDKFYEITSNGVIIPSKKKEKSKIIKIVGLKHFGIMDYKKLFEEKYISKINKINELIKFKSSFINIIDLTYYYKEAELHIIDKNGIIIIIDLNKEEEVQIEKLNIFYKEYLNKIKSGIIYLDLRINEKIIYCPRDNEFQCKSNLKNIYD